LIVQLVLSEQSSRKEPGGPSEVIVRLVLSEQSSRKEPSGPSELIVRLVLSEQSSRKEPSDPSDAELSLPCSVHCHLFEPTNRLPVQSRHPVTNHRLNAQNHHRDLSHRPSGLLRPHSVPSRRRSVRNLRNRIRIGPREVKEEKILDVR
jgi:hypothetical protein